jgi:hypothetical protein
MPNRLSRLCTRPASNRTIGHSTSATKTPTPKSVKSVQSVVKKIPSSLLRISPRDRFLEEFPAAFPKTFQTLLLVRI